MHLLFFLEEQSAEAFLQGMLPKMLPSGTTWKPIVFQGKLDLLKKLEQRLRGYRWIPSDWKIVVLVDRDDGNCLDLKKQMEKAAKAAGFPTKSHPKGRQFVVLNRIAIEELEAWFFGDIVALATAYPGVSPTLSSKASYRNPDGISGGTWETLQRVLQQAGYFKGGLPKTEVARKMGGHMVPQRNQSGSFQHFAAGLAAL